MDQDWEVTKQQIQMAWDYTKVETDIHSRVYLQVFVVFLTTGLSLIIGGFTEPLSSLEPYIAVAGFIIIFLSLFVVLRIQGLTLKLESTFTYLIDLLENLKKGQNISNMEKGYLDDKSEKKA